MLPAPADRSCRRCTLTTPASEPVAAQSDDTASAVPRTQPSSTARARHRCVRRSHVCTTPSLPVRLKDVHICQFFGVTLLLD